MLYAIHCILLFFLSTDLHLQILQHQARLKHENFTVSYHSYPTLLPQNILQLRLHFNCAFYNINNLRFAKIKVSWDGELPLHIPNFQIYVSNSTQKL